MSNTTEPVERSEKEDRGFFGQPFALANLFGVEMWERFSFYGMQGILIYYLYYSVSDGGLGISQAAATSIVGAYGGTVYLSTILGAWVADRLLGSERTLFYSASLVMAGHIALSVLPGMWGVGVGLVMVAFGSGGLKANATSLVGDLYSEQDVRRDAGFSIFYMGINIGGLVGPLLTGAVQDAWGFQRRFCSRCRRHALGLIQYTLGRKHLHGIGAEPGNPLPADKRALYIGIGIAAIVVVAVASVTGLITADNMSDVVVGLTIVASVGYFLLMLTSKKVTKVERSRVFAFIPMFIASAAFWSLFQQQFTTVPVISDKLLDRNLFGWDFRRRGCSRSIRCSSSSLPVCSQRCGTKLGDRQPSSPIKFALGTGTMGLAFLAFIPITGGGPNSAPLLGLAVCFCSSPSPNSSCPPSAFSLATKLAPEHFHTQMVALFFLSVALGSSMAGTLAGYFDIDDSRPFFLIIGFSSIGIGVILALASPWIKKLMQGVK